MNIRTPEQEEMLKLKHVVGVLKDDLVVGQVHFNLTTRI